MKEDLGFGWLISKGTVLRIGILEQSFSSCGGRRRENAFLAGGPNHTVQAPVCDRLASRGTHRACGSISSSITRSSPKSQARPGIEQRRGKRSQGNHRGPSPAGGLAEGREQRGTPSPLTCLNGTAPGLPRQAQDTLCCPEAAAAYQKQALEPNVFPFPGDSPKPTIY